MKFYFCLNSKQETMDLRESTTNQTNVSFTIANHLFSKESHKDNNVVFSPLSLQLVLSIIAAGSEGSTQQQLLEFLQSKSTDHLNSFASQLVSDVLTDAAPAGGPLLSFVNGVWIEQTLSLQPSFKQIVSTDFKANLSSVDFQNKADEVTNEVNLWAEKETNDLIKELVPQGSIDSDTRLVFANALYFKGVWNNKFDVSLTKDNDFHLLNGSAVKVPFMTSKKMQFIRKFNDFKVLGLPYKQGEDNRRFSMYIFLPNAKDGLSALVEKVASEAELLDRLPSHQVEVGDFKIPRFKISFGLEISDVLKELGVVLPFSTGGFTKMVDSLEGQNLCVSNIFHKSFIEVNEEGTEAAAASTAYMLMRCRRVPIDFAADHPFIFVIREDLSGAILFVGQVLNPLDG
ncbi:serpin-ZX-like [Vicia villosa]|uniref:serpin-ZX-like n=1 Tax=Vicia villosa TaxID=3911 RepID=UPI00273B78D2|nr:serpin-ZX-like [Vicia villosa]